MRVKPLDGKKILFLSWPFYEYPEKIKRQLEDLGAEVTYYSSAPTRNFLKIRFLEHFEGLKRKYFKNILNEISRHSYDYMFMINAAIFPEYFLQELNQLCKDTCKILYSWDSLSVYPNAQKMHQYFDFIYSFDTDDVNQYPYMRFLPLFYCDDMFDGNVRVDYKYDFSFVGFGHTERYKFIQEIKKFADENEFTYFFKLYLPSKIHYIRGKYIKGLFKTASVNDFVYNPIPHETIKSVTNDSKIVVDIELSNQSGLTMRTIETHGMRKKLITTNKNIKDYDFYDPQNICVVDRNQPVIDREFVNSDYKVLPNDLYMKYSLSYWLRTVFRCNDEN